MSKDVATIVVCSAFLSAILVVCIACWVISSHFESKTYTELTGRSVTTWQAMWVQLRVIEPARED